MSERESMPYDVVIVGGGPAGLSAAIRLKQLANEAGRELSVCILEKGSEIGAHILSGAVLDPRALEELLPNWRDLDSPLTVPVTKNEHWVLTAGKKYPFPHALMPSFMNNHGTYTLSLGNFCRWLAGQAEALGVEIFPGFAAAEVLFNEDGSVKGVATGDMGVARDGTHKPDYQPGMELHGRYTLFAEGARGHLTKELKRIFELERDCQPQVYGIGLKELWDIDPDKHEPGRVIHTQGWPLDDAWGGGFLYHQANGQVALGLRRRAQLQKPLALAVRGIPALEAASGDPPFPGGRQAHLLRRAGDQRGRLAIGADARLPGRRVDRLLGRLRERAPDQGQPHRDEIGHARGRERLRGDRGRSLAATRSPITSRRCGEAGSPTSSRRSAMSSRWSPNGAARSAPCSPAPTCGCASSISACRSR